ncbi:fibrillarin, S-adenosyl-L-methionine-dependent methyltransferase [Artemisia annua]|uniref:Fibrillarin, S-adenosyl-L-methionine-dependent methyltransferase n=1 Tax=Artemisia annua TaxID=35608 RepID=A0A2U1Q663_ARTAN|nr:fibrillarin, S-adenosyl-L-methionine-dependent methyltransferase [Artemisia annua]
MRVPVRAGKRGEVTRGGGGRGRGGGRRRGKKRSSELLLKPYRHEGVFKAKKENGEKAYCTQNLVPGDSAYSERLFNAQNEDGVEVEYRVWNPYRSLLAAVLCVKVDDIWMAPGSKVLYLGAASGITVSHVSDLVGPTGVVFAVESSRRSYADLFVMSKKRTNLIPILGDARNPAKYETKLDDKYKKMLDEKVDVIYCDVTQPDQVEILVSNASRFLKVGGHFLMLTKAVCIDPRATVCIDPWTSIPLDVVFSSEAMKLQAKRLKPIEQVTLEPFVEGHACLIGAYLGPKIQNQA